MKLSELAKITRIDDRSISSYARSGQFKTAYQKKCGHVKNQWFISDEEAQKFIENGCKF